MYTIIYKNIFRRTISSLPPKKGKGKLPLFRGNGEQVNPMYGTRLGYTNGKNTYFRHIIF